MDNQILPGEHWRAEIDQALERSRFGLLLLSPQFFARDFIMEKELPPLLAKPMVVPVALHRIPLDGRRPLAASRVDLERLYALRTETYRLAHLRVNASRSTVSAAGTRSASSSSTRPRASSPGTRRI